MTAQARLARTHVCVVGAGSVGSIVLECLARTGFELITVIDPDLVEDRNMDRLIYADRHCLGLPKANVAAAHLRRIATAHHPVIRPVPLSIRTERAYRLAADADLIVCCVDNAEAREVLNHLAYANCLPLIDGGVLVESRDRLLSAKWRVHLVGPDMQCLRCRGQYTSGDARDERMGIRRHGRYINNGAPDGLEPGQNTIAFCNLVAAEQMRMLVRYTIGEDWWHDGASTAGQWAFEHRFVEAGNGGIRRIRADAWRAASSRTHGSVSAKAENPDTHSPTNRGTLGCSHDVSLPAASDEVRPCEIRAMHLTQALPTHVASDCGEPWSKTRRKRRKGPAYWSWAPIPLPPLCAAVVSNRHSLTSVSTSSICVLHLRDPPRFHAYLASWITRSLRRFNASNSSASLTLNR